MRSAAILTACVAIAAASELEAVELPGGSGGIGFDDVRFSSELRKVLVPAGRTGQLALVDPLTRAVETIGGFSSSAPRARDHSEGTTSADAGAGLLFASDRTRRTLSIVHPVTKKIVAHATLTGGPDYVRWVAPLREVWVSEPDAMVIEMFRLDGGSDPKLTRVGTVRIPDGPESLEIDTRRRRAYANTWHDTTVAVDLDARTVVARWANACKGARGLAVDPERGLAFVGCAEGAAIALDVAHDGAIVGRAPTGKGVDVIAFSPTLSHLYVPGAESASLTVVGVGRSGALRVLGAVRTARDAHCVATDDAGHAFVCDPARGRVLVFRDPYPSSR